MGLSGIIREQREKLGLTQDQVADNIGISKPYLSNIETGRAKNPPTDGILVGLEKALGFPAGYLQKLAHMARTPIDVRQEHELLEAEVGKLRSVLKDLISGKKTTDAVADCDLLLGESVRQENISVVAVGSLVPIINKVAAGYPQHFTDLDYPTSVADEYIRCPDLHDPQAFAARVVGDSMQPDYCEGDIVVFAPNRIAVDGNDCFIRFADDNGTTFKRVYQDDGATVRLQPLNSKYPSQVHPRESINGIWPAEYRIQRVPR